MRNFNVFNLGEGEYFEIRVKSTLLDIKKQLEGHKIFKIDVFLHSNNSEEYLNECDIINTYIKEIFKGEIPATTYISNDPAFNDDVLFSCQSNNDNSIKINFKKLLNHHYTTIEHKDGIELISGGIHFNESSQLLSFQRAFDFAEQLLMAEDMNFGNLYRQWNYIPSINEISDFNNSSKSNFEIINELKSIFTDESIYKNGYPSVSDIGINLGGMTIDFMALSNYSQSSTLDIESEYYLPFSEIAKFLNLENDEIWISGSCLNFKPTKDIEKQTLKALDETFKLIDCKNLESSNIKTDQKNNFKAGFKLIKAYVKFESHNQEVKKIINSVLPDTNCIIINTEFYNKEKLIELESFTSL